MSKRKKYTEAFKLDAIRLQESSGKSIGAIERELGLSHNLLRQWKQKYTVDETNNQLELNEVEQLRREVRQLKRELAITEQERDILKKTISIFSQDQRR